MLLAKLRSITPFIIGDDKWFERVLNSILALGDAMLLSETCYSLFYRQQSLHWCKKKRKYTRHEHRRTPSNFHLDFCSTSLLFRYEIHRDFGKLDDLLRRIGIVVCSRVFEYAVFVVNKSMLRYKTLIEYKFFVSLCRL